MTRSSALAIRTRGLRKVFGGKVAVRNLTLDVPQGEVFGFLGPNGAGKSTSVKMLLGLVFPTSGEAEILGRPMGDVKVRSKVGFLPEHFRFYDWLTPAELLKLHGRLYGVSQSALRERIPALLDLVGLTPHRDKRLQEFSKGMLQRIGLAQALLNDPELIFLDEPTSGLDPLGRRMAAKITADMMHGLAPWTSSPRWEGERLTLSLSSSDLLPEVVRYLVRKGADIYEVAPQRLSLEERFLEIVGQDGGL